MSIDTPPIRPEPWAGLLVPPANPTVEPEMHALLDGAASLYAARFAVMPGTTLEERNGRYLGMYRDAVTSFGDMKLAAILIALTGPSYRLRPARDLELTRELTAHAGGIPVLTASQAIAQALGALAARRLCLLSPYPEWLTAEAVAYWQEAGHEVVQVIKISETFRAYQLTDDEVAAALRSVDQDRVDATVMSGTGMLTLASILAARTTATKPILSSNLCSAWWLLRAAGKPSAPSLLERAAPELAARLGR